METLPKLHRPVLVAAWPGMGNVAMTAGFYLMAKMEMHALAELSSPDSFEVKHVDVKDGIIRPGRLPASRFYLWQDPNKEQDLVVFLGEAQPPLGNLSYCTRVIQFAKEIGVEQVFTFAAMATDMHPNHASRVFVAAIDQPSLDDLRDRDVEVLEEGQISGLNGVLLGVAQQQDLRGACLLGEMPHMFIQLPYPKASLAVLQTFVAMSKIPLDLTELGEQADTVDEQLGDLMASLEQRMRAGVEQEDEAEQPYLAEPVDESALDAESQHRLEELFEQAARDRRKAYELKRELDRLGVFEEYENRFLDLFKQQ